MEKAGAQELSVLEYLQVTTANFTKRHLWVGVRSWKMKAAHSLLKNTGGEELSLSKTNLV